MWSVLVGLFLLNEVIITYLSWKYKNQLSSKGMWYPTLYNLITNSNQFFTGARDVKKIVTVYTKSYNVAIYSIKTEQWQIWRIDYVICYYMISDCHIWNDWVNLDSKIIRTLLLWILQLTWLFIHPSKLIGFLNSSHEFDLSLCDVVKK